MPFHEQLDELAARIADVTLWTPAEARQFLLDGVTGVRRYFD